MTPYRLLGFFFFSLIFLSSSAAKGRTVTRYPFVLAHGILASDKLLSMHRMAKALRADGHEVFLSEVSAVGGVSLRAEQLGEQVNRILTQTHSDRVNVIGHSMGGLDARYLVSSLKFAPKVASVTTLSTPHRGSPVADELYAKLSEGAHAGAVKLVELFALLINQATVLYESDLLDGLWDLTTDHAAQFNREVEDSPLVYYQSYAADAVHAEEPRGIHRALKKGHRTIAAVEGRNDGMVSISSAKWGDFRGTVIADHFSVAGLGNKNVAPFDVESFIKVLGRDLAERGF